MKEYLVLRVVTKLLVPFILLFALYVQFHGDFGPGGGFQAGVIFASGFVLYGMVFGVAAARRILPVGILRAGIAIGVLIYAGVGIAASEAKRVFKRFYRVPNLSTQKTKGTGLGLHISRSIIRKHRGKIFVESKGEGRGSVFIVRLPKVDGPATAD